MVQEGDTTLQPENDEMSDEIMIEAAEEMVEAEVAENDVENDVEVEVLEFKVEDVVIEQIDVNDASPDKVNKVVCSSCRCCVATCCEQEEKGGKVSVSACVSKSSQSKFKTEQKETLESSGTCSCESDLTTVEVEKNDTAVCAELVEFDTCKAATTVDEDVTECVELSECKGEDSAFGSGEDDTVQSTVSSDKATDLSAVSGSDEDCEECGGPGGKCDDCGG